jgi:NAD kinase/nicotinic acid mononucleotide adenylyltransferase
MSKRIALLGLSGNPPTLVHDEMANILTMNFDEVIVELCGPRRDKEITDDISPIHRAAMGYLAFANRPKVRFVTTDLERDHFTRTHTLVEQYSKEGEVWVVVGDDLIQGGGKGEAYIQRVWENGVELWQNAKFAVFASAAIDTADLPPHYQLYHLTRPLHSTVVRESAFQHRTIQGMVLPLVADYIERHQLYRGHTSYPTRFVLDRFEPMIVADDKNERAVNLSRKLKATSVNPNFVYALGGDGTMLRAIRAGWGYRLPFIGCNFGHTGYLMNGCDISSEVNARFNLYHQPMLHIEAQNLRQEKVTGYAFNDVRFERIGINASKIGLRILDKGRVWEQELMGDGVMVATAAGSTGYAIACGATPILLGDDSLMLVGSNIRFPAHWPPTVFSSNAVFEFINLDTSVAQKERALRAVVDNVDLHKVNKLTVRLSRIAGADIAFLPQYDPYVKRMHERFGREGE